MSNSPIFRGPLLAALSLVCPLAAADDAGTQLDEIVVTATRTAQTQDQTLAAMTVITREDIDKLQPASLLDLLATTPSMAMSNSGGPGKASSLFLRGTSGSQLLVLVDGVRIGTVSAGTIGIPYIPLDQVQRIEIVRGPFSSLYGSGAIGGVVQIFLRHDPGSFSPNASVAAGSYASYKGAAGFSASGEQGWISVQGSREKTDGINACRVGAATAFAGCFADQPDKDGFDDSALTLNGAWRFNERWSVDGLAFRSEGSSEFDGDYSDSNRYSVQVVGGHLRYRPSERVNVSLRAGSSTDFDTSFLAGAMRGHFDNRRDLGSLQGDFGLGPGLLTLGYDWERQWLGSDVGFDQTTRLNRGLFGQWQMTLGKQSLQANLRRDDNSQFGGKTTGSVLWGWDFAEGLRVVANYGTAFRAPTFNDLYYPGYANPLLRPENSRNAQLGLRGTPGWGNWSVEAWHNDVRDLIAFDAVSYTPANIGHARIHGIEAVVGSNWFGWDVRASATLMHARDVAHDSPTRGKQLARRPERSAQFDADRKFGDFSVGASWQLAGHRYDDFGNTHPLGGYGLLRLRAGWQFNPDWRLDLALNNVLDKRYETAWYFNQPGRNVMLTLNWRPAH